MFLQPLAYQDGIELVALSFRCWLSGFSFRAENFFDDVMSHKVSVFVSVLAAASFARATETVKGILRERGTATASELRQALGTNRRVVIPLLERLDKDGVTRREGDKRTLRK